MSKLTLLLLFLLASCTNKKDMERLNPDLTFPNAKMEKEFDPSVKDEGCTLGDEEKIKDPTKITLDQNDEGCTGQ
jgi:hypothetical protein